MDEKRRKAMRASLGVAVPVLVFVAAWAFLSLFHSPYADWLKVEAPRYAVVGSPLDVRITIGKAPEPSLLAVSVYLLGKDLNGAGRLPAPSPPVSVHSGGTYPFRIDVTEKKNMAFVQLVIWLSPTGDWQTRTNGANMEPIPVRNARPRAEDGEFREVRAYAISNAQNPDIVFQPGGRPPKSEAYPASSAPFRLGLAALLASSGLVFILNLARRRPARDRGGWAGKERLFWMGTAILLFLLALSELFVLEGRLSEWGRKIIIGLDLYNFRQSYQKAGLALIAAGIGVLLVLFPRLHAGRRDRFRTALAGLALAVYVGLSLAGALSFHYVDVARRISFAGLSLIDAVKAACAAAVLLLGFLAFRSEKAYKQKQPDIIQSKTGERGFS
jgi:hypothetical protein